MAIGIYDEDAKSIVEVLTNMTHDTIDRFFDSFSEEGKSRERFLC